MTFIKQNRLMKKPVTLLIILWLAFSLIRTLLSFAVILIPKNLIDEMLYMNIARSLANGTGILFKGQPANYTFLFYPLILAPVYALFPAGSSYFQIIQAYNSLLMSLSVFPLYGIACEVTGDKRKALLPACLGMLCPDFLLSGIVFSEAVVWPMLLTVFWLTLRYLKKPSLTDLLLIGLLCGFLYETKPGQAAPAALAILFCGILKKKPLHILAGLGSAAAVLGLFYLAFGTGLSMSIYTPQLMPEMAVDEAGKSKQITAFAKGILYAPYALLISVGAPALLLPLLRFRHREKTLNRFYIYLLLSLAAIVIGTAWTVNASEYEQFTLHTRYFAMFVPPMLIFCFAEEKTETPEGERLPAHTGLNDKQLLGVLAVAVYMIAGTFLLGGFDNLYGNRSRVANVALSLYRLLPDTWCVILVILLTAGTLLLLVKVKNRDRLTRIATVTAAILLTVQNICFYSFYGSGQSPRYSRDAAAALKTLNGQAYVSVSNNVESGYYGLADANNKQDVPVLGAVDLFNSLSRGNGVFVPIEPIIERGMASVTEVQPSEYILLDYPSYPMFVFSEDCELLSDPDAALVLVKVPLDKRCVDSVMAGHQFNDYELTEGSEAYIRVFTGDNKVELSMDIDTATAGTIVFTDLGGAELMRLELDAGRHTYSTVLTGTLNLVTMVASGTSPSIYSYGIASVE